MIVGCPTNPTKNIIEEIRNAKEKGFDFVELFLEGDKALPEKLSAEKIRKELEKNELGALGHTPWYLPTGTMIQEVKKSMIKEFNKYFKFFKKIGVEYVTVHSRIGRGMYPREEKINQQIKNLKEIMKKAEKQDIKIIYELSEEDDLKMTKKVLDSVKNLYFNLDIGHANIRPNNPIDFIKELHPKIKHVHLHDNDGEKDQHLPMGAGIIEWDELIRELKKYYDGTITLEIFSQFSEYRLVSKEKLKEMWIK